MLIPPKQQKFAEPEKTSSIPTMSDDPAAQLVGKPASYDLSSVVETLLASPEFQKSPRFDDFLVSPSLSPCEDFTMSPIDDSPLTQTLDTPIMNDLSDDFGLYATEYGGVPLFNDGAMTMYQLIESQEVMQSSKSAPDSELPLLPAFDAVSPSFLESSPDTTATALPTPALSPPADSPVSRPTKKGSGRGRKSAATGTRKNVTPESLVSVDAPIQSRKYVTPSSTSRKELPAAFLKLQKRKRSRAQAFDNELEDEVETASVPVSKTSERAESVESEEQPPLNASDKEIIEWKRRQNTLAARKSRKRKLEHQQFLETRVKDLETENDTLRVRADALEAALRAHNILMPSMEA
ncbi:hypothetical protein D9757_000435 [Collybiopsis confluens]|uniref:BZIP domain-containing protein n=1 Tax=Collybiopsis confluens TaxID=2823264 RepID=A0A8H5MHC3_9AGAR|nr:hypothetical protein D9757_000435 [Collybiopsis confluens]